MIEIELPENRTLDVSLEKETMRVKVIAMNKNGREGVGVMLTTPIEAHFVNTGVKWGAFVHFAKYGENEPPRIVHKVFEMIGENEWKIL